MEALNADPTAIEQLTVPAIIEHLESVVGELDQPPILMGHSAGGVFTQILMDHGFGAVGVAIDSAPTEGVKRVPLAQIKATFPVLKNRANRHKAVGFTLEQWHYAFTNTFSEEDRSVGVPGDTRRARAADVRVHVPARIARAPAGRDASAARRGARQPGHDGRLRVNAGVTSPAEFFSEDNIGRISRRRHALTTIG